ncbi:uncharacterized protein LOC120709241 [Panicum virgatum]|uniref:uncharacterized protein LOC120709241 n=1 Tax=Panicum virgatum TaxID=38727 RepID=UPI0019D64E3F|nr:uncharacterized protein LOC120709241 [Panicum virgatum]
MFRFWEQELLGTGTRTWLLRSAGSSSPSMEIDRRGGGREEEAARVSVARETSGGGAAEEMTGESIDKGKIDRQMKGQYGQQRPSDDLVKFAHSMDLKFRRVYWDMSRQFIYSLVCLLSSRQVKLNARASAPSLSFPYGREIGHSLDPRLWS